MSTASAPPHENDLANDSAGGGLIVPMDNGSIQRIVAGQAVTDLASAVKELVDNALDAGAKTINIRLFNQGLDVIEVSDDGSGVPLNSRPFVAQKHATSKIRSFQDIYSHTCTTLGFRGEALFCLANLSENLVLVTRTRQDVLGQKLEYLKNGALDVQSITSVPRKVGTTVAVSKLFHALPVRRADLIKRIKAQRSKVVSMIQGYAILCLGVRFNLIDVTKKGNSYREDTKLSTTNASNKVEQTMSSILGSRFVSGMTRVSIDLEPALYDNNNSVDTTTQQDGSVQWKVEGLVSKAPSLTARDGSVARESQFFSINGRPVELPKISRAISDAWRAFEGTKKRPACVLCFTLPNNEYDVNLSPDKREVLLTHQDAICSLIHAQLTKVWTSQNGGNFAADAVSVPQERPTEKVKTQPERAEMKSQPEVAHARTRSAVAAVPAPSNTATDTATGNDANPLVEGSPGRSRRFQRRNAFLHDPTMARLQHEQDVQITAPQYFHQPQNMLPQSGGGDGASTSHSLEEQNANAEHGVAQHDSQAPAASPNSIPKATPTIAELEQTKAIPSDGPSPVPIDNGDRPNDKERLGWSSVRASFMRGGRDHQVDEIEALEQHSQRRNIGETVSPQETNTIRNQSQQTKSASEKPATSTVATKRTRSFTLEDFAFQPNKKATKTSDSRTAASVTAATGAPSKPTSREAKPRNDSVESEQVEIDSRKRFGLHLSQEQQRVEKHRKRQKPTSTDRDTGTARDDQGEESHEMGGKSTPAEPEKTLVWNSFYGTDAVMEATKDARFSMRSFRKELRAISRAPQDADSADVAVGGIENDTGDDEKSASQVEDTDTSNKNVVSLSKQDFRDFTIIGQYNLGFILAKCRKNHLWVLDQHACDEKYNFERLRANTVMHEQKLIAPMPLELSPSEESCILENMQVFEENGFRFAHDPDKPPRYRLSLTALPHSGAQDGRKAVQFGKEDVHALCAMLSEEDGYSQDGGTGADGSGMYGNNAVRRHAGISQTQDSASKVLARLPKAVAMFANRACRGSIMIGTALSQKEMETVVKRLADVENPWSCPHGRPTMRHVKDLTSIMMEDEQRAASLIAGPTMAVMTQQMTQEQNTETLSQQLDNEDA